MKESVAWPYARTEIEETKKIKALNKELMQLLGEAVCSATKEPFFNEPSWVSKAKSILNKQ